VDVALVRVLQHHALVPPRQPLRRVVDMAPPENGVANWQFKITATKTAGQWPSTVPSRILSKLGVHLLVGRVLGHARGIARERRRPEVLMKQQRNHDQQDEDSKKPSDTTRRERLITYVGVERGGGGPPRRGVEGEERGEEAERGLGHGRGERVPEPARVRVLRAERGGVRDPGAAPVVVGRGAAELEDLVDLLHLGAPLQYGAARVELGEDAPRAPEVHGGRVRGGAQQQLRRAVPERDHAAGHRRRRRREEVGEAEVRDLELAGVAHQQVRALDVAVHHPTRVAVGQALHQLPHVALDLQASHSPQAVSD
jgi:hypothetical protein